MSLRYSARFCRYVLWRPAVLLSVIKRTPLQIQRAVIFALLMRELKTRFPGHWSSVVWLLGEPLLKLGILVLMYAQIRGMTVRGGFAFPVWLLVAMLPFDLSTGLWRNLMNGIKSNKGLFGYKQVKPLDTLVARSLLELMLSFVVFCIAFFGLGILGYEPVWPEDFLKYFLVVLMFVGLGMGLGLICAVGLNYMPRMGFIVSLVSMPLQILSGAIFPIDSLPKEILAWLSYNPYWHLVEGARAAFLSGYLPAQELDLIYPVWFALVTWALGLSLYWVTRLDLATGR